MCVSGRQVRPADVANAMKVNYTKVVTVSQNRKHPYGMSNTSGRAASGEVNFPTLTHGNTSDVSLSTKLLGWVFVPSTAAAALQPSPVHQVLEQKRRWRPVCTCFIYLLMEILMLLRAQQRNKNL